MEQNNLISHAEIADLGFYFMDHEQEEAFLQVINDEFALRVGEEITSCLPRDKLMVMAALPKKEMRDFIRRTIPGIEEKVIRIRNDLLDELREERRSILLGAGSDRTI